MRFVDTGVESVQTVETENVINEFQAGSLFGEIALMDSSKSIRVLSTMTKTDCILLQINKEAFDIMIRDKMNKDRDEMGKFVYQSIPKLKDNFTLYNVIHNVHVLFQE